MIKKEGGREILNCKIKVIKLGWINKKQYILIFFIESMVF
jgi:hypothetical protein